MASQEVIGSRREWQTGKHTFGEMLHVGDAPSDAPSTGDYFTPKGGSIESGLTGRKCIRVDKDPEIVPGIMFFRAIFQAFKAYS